MGRGRAIRVLWFPIASMAMAVAVQSQAKMDTAGLLAMWLCDDGGGEFVIDASRNGFDGEFVDEGGSPEWVEGVFGGGIEFDASGWVETADPVVVDTRGFSMGCWAKPGDEQKPWANIMSSHQEPPCRGISFEQGQNTLNVYGVPIGVRQWNACGPASYVLDTGEWNHMVIVREDDGKSVQCYLNGDHFLTDSLCGSLEPIEAATSNFRLGNWVLGNRNWSGVIDEAFVFNRALSEDEVMSLYNDGGEAALGVSPQRKLLTTWADVKANSR